MSRFGWVSHSKRSIKNWMLLIALLLLPLSVAQADEAILDFHSDITVNRDGSFNVVERITVNAEGLNIKRGVYRDLPTSYDHPKYGKFGFKSKAPIEVHSLLRNGDHEPYHVQALNNGIRIFFGSKQRYLEHGEHTYTLSYTAERQVAVNDGIAQLYWNVTGNGWGFRIEQASAQVTLPDNASIHQQEVYTGYQGSSASDAQFALADNRDLKVAATSQLRAGQGMTIRVRFDAANIAIPQASELAALYSDNKLWFWGASLLVLMGVMFLCCWHLIGRDPRRGIIIAQYRPVKELSAAAHRAVFRNRVDDTSFSVGVLSAAIKGWLTISKPRRDTFRLTSTDKPDSESDATNRIERKPLSPSEELLVKGLFDGRDSVTLDGVYDSRLKKLKERYDVFLMSEFADKSHQNHVWPLVIGGLIGLAGLLLMATVGLTGKDSLIGIMLVVAIVVAFISIMVVRRKDWPFGYSLATISLAVAAINFYYANTLMALGFVVFGVLLGLFSYLMPAPKQAAVGTLDQIEGFRLYLSKAEHESLKRLDLPEKTPQLYEELLPFAIALDLETEWSGQFTDVLAAANWDSDKHSQRSAWYAGGSGSSMGSFAPAIAAGLASSVVAASTPPSSSSSSGGGFSGGGGGGGGGGGW
ncbi:DUF2207 domain-containing protein [Arenicella xantha]|uniref:Putative membrane protein DUF2207 n=1 Tax=Arenicella xantha TaxID=644221 RepID=A0A395JNW8_9GAMM|nr:DUF2207 domain-containing protein [Arenicella xantha]RBP51254.1 putative membrane protein DUF2207 [Arenicella xantha]